VLSAHPAPGLEGWALKGPEGVGREEARRTLRRLGARRIPTGAYPVVFEREMAASLLRHLAGAISGGALYRRASYLVDHLGEQIAADTYEPTQYQDEEKNRILAAIDQKIAGERIVAAAHPEDEAGGQVIDLMAALQASLGKAGKAKPAPTPAGKVSQK